MKDIINDRISTLTSLGFGWDNFHKIYAYNFYRDCSITITEEYTKYATADEWEETISKIERSIQDLKAAFNKV